MNKWCTDTSDLRHFGPKTFRHWWPSVHWTFRHHRKNPRHFHSPHWCRSVNETLWHQCRNVLDTSVSVTLIYLFKKDYFIDDLW